MKFEKNMLVTKASISFIIFTIVIAGICYFSNFMYCLAFLVELLVLGVLLSFSGRFSDFIAYVMSMLVSMQVTSIFIIGNYIPALMFSNLVSYQTIGMWAITSIFLFVIFFICIAHWVKHISKTVRTTKYSYISKSILAVVVYILFNTYAYITPVYSFGLTFQEFIQTVLYSPSTKDRALQQYLYSKKYVYKPENISEEIADLSNKNVIVIFTEGLSSIELGANNNLYPNLTPSISDFMDKSISFDNYFNHTAATFRGIRGQLTSSYQFTGGHSADNSGVAEIGEDALKQKFNSTIVSIIDILNDKGYNTYFLSSHPRQEPLSVMLKHMNVKHVFCSDDHKSEEVDYTDQEIYAQLTDLIVNKKLKEPYFIGVYNIGTHLGQDSPDKKYGDGDNVYLNTVHNYDDAFGKFWKAFKNSTAAEDTLLVLTSDHAAYPSNELLKTFNMTGTENSFFINKIPLAFYYKGISPKRIDAKGKNSLNLTPTILNFLRINNANNYFLGCSLFEDKCKYDFQYVSNIGGGYFSTRDKLCKQIKRVRAIKKFFALSEN